MEMSDLRERPGLPRAADGVPVDLVTSKLLPPLARRGTIRRPVLDRLAGGDPRRIVSVVAPPGYGKTTLLAQWAELSGTAFAWVSVDERDNDPKILLSYVAQALDAVQPVGRRVFDALATAASSVPGSVVPRLGAAFASMTVPVVLVLDDVHLLENREGRDALSILAEHVPPGSRLVLAGRAAPPLRVARLRAEGRLLEVGPADLALTRPEAAALLREAGLALGPGEVAALHQRTEGWPAGLYLAALHLAAQHLREGGSLGTAAVSFGGDDRLVSEYIRAEFLATISRRHREFLTRTAMLEQMSGPLCEAVLELPGAAAILAELARSNLLLVPLDRRGVWYRYHHLFRDMLLAELERAEPGLLPALRRGPPPGAWPTAGPPTRWSTRSPPGTSTRSPSSGPGWRPSRPASAAGASSLTAAELRVLPMLATHLSFPEIAAQIFVSPHTVKSQAMSLYRKLGASSRSQAVARSRELGLLDR